MCSALDVAAFILQEKGRLSGYQLQKLLYYCQAWFLVTQDRPLFEEEVRAWGHGPVIYEVFREHRGRHTVVSSDVPGDASKLDVAEIELVLAVLDSYGMLSGDEIAELSHDENPWESVYNGRSGIDSAVISNESMFEYYSEIMASDEGTRARHHVPKFYFSGRSFVSAEDADFLATLV